MSYSLPQKRTYTFAHDFGAGTERYAIRGPKGKAGKLIDYGVMGVIETFNAVTTSGMIAVGTAADPDAFGEELTLGTLAADDAMTVRSTYNEVADKADFDALMVDTAIPADTAVLVTCTAPTGGTPAGIGTAYVEIDWAD